MNRIKQIISVLISVSLFTGFVGCGSTTQEEVNLTPHMKDTRTLEKDWTWDVGVRYMENLVFFLL